MTTVLGVGLTGLLVGLEEASADETNALRALLSQLSEMIMVIDRDGRIRFINRVEPGYTAAQLLGSSVYDWVSAEQHREMRECFERVAHTRQPDGYPSTVVDPDGALTHWASRVSPVTDGDRVVAFTVISSNVTESERSAAERERFFDLSVDWLCVGDERGVLTRASQSVMRTLGYSFEELTAKSLLSFVHPDDLEQSQKLLGTVLEGDHATDFRTRVRCRDDTYRTIAWRSTFDPITRRVYAVARDMTKQETVEAQVNLAQKLDAIGQLAGGIAHDFNNLVQAIFLNLDAVLTRGRGLADQDRSNISDAVAAAQKAAELARQLQTFGRAESMTRGPCDLNTVVTDMTRLIGRLIPESITMELELDRDLPTLNADGGQLGQVVANLCLNARDALPDGGTIRIETHRRMAGSSSEHCMPDCRSSICVILRISDDGIGIDDEVRERIFEPFFTTKPVGRGTGLGLATVYGIVAGHEGSIRVDTTKDVGTTFTVCFPALASMPRDSAVEATRRPTGGHETILVAEDQPLLRASLVGLLEEAGYRVIAVEDGEAAVAALLAHGNEVDAVLLDVIMPKLGGPAAFVRMRETRPDLAALFISGYAESQEIQQAFPDGTWPAGTLRLAKPFHTDELLSRLRTLLDRMPTGPSDAG